MYVLLPPGSFAQRAPVGNGGYHFSYHVEVYLTSGLQAFLKTIACAAVCLCLFVTCELASDSTLLYDQDWENAALSGIITHNGELWQDLGADDPYGSKSFYFCVTDDHEETYTDFFNVSIESVPSPSGGFSNALKFVVTADDPDTPALTRCSYNYKVGWGDSAFNDLEEGFNSFWIKLPANLNTLLDPTSDEGWMMLAEWDEYTVSGNGGRIGLYLERRTYENGGVLYLRATCQTKVENLYAGYLWNITNTTFDVSSILGEWAFVEIYWKHGDSDGAFRVAINNDVVLEAPGNDTKCYNDFYQGCSLKSYSNRNGIVVYYDDYKHYNGVPPGAALRTVFRSHP